MNEDYLIHYGVLGMKWGVRKDYTSQATKRYRKNAVKAASKYGKASQRLALESTSKYGTSRQEKRIKKLTNKANKAKQRFDTATRQAERSQQLDSNMYKKANESRGLYTVAFFNGGAAKTYAMVTSAGGKKSIAAGSAAVATMLGGPAGQLAYRSIFRKSYVNSTY